MMDILMDVIMFLAVPMVVNGSLNLLYPLRRITFFRLLDRPIDLGAYFFDGNRILGDSTTFPGIFVAIVVGSITGFFILNSVYVGLVAGITTYIGHAFGSFIKRRFNIPGGKFLPIIDHSDYVIVTGIAYLILDIISIQIFVIAWFVTLIIHPIFCLVGHKAGIRKDIL